MRNITWLTGGENCVTIIQMRQADCVVRGKCRMLTGETAGVPASVGWRSLKYTFSGDGFVPWITQGNEGKKCFLTHLTAYAGFL